MILHKINSKSTWVKPTKNQIKGDIIIARDHALTRIHLYRLNPKHKILDNEASHKYRKAIRASGMTYQIVPPEDHHHKIFGKAIQFWKDHVIAVISGVAPTFPLYLWCHVVLQADFIIIIMKIKCQQKHIIVCPLRRQP